MATSESALLNLRLDSELLARVDGEASAAGVTRSAWMRALILSVLEPESRAIPEPEKRDQTLRRVYCGVPANLLDKIDVEAKATGLRRNVFIRRVLHAHVYEGERFRVLSKRSDQQFATLKGKLSALERMVNRVERAVKAIERDRKHRDLAVRVDELLEMRENITAAFKAIESFMVWVTFEEHRYWRRACADDQPQPDGGSIAGPSAGFSDGDEDLTAGFSEDDVGAGD